MKNINEIISNRNPKSNNKAKKKFEMPNIYLTKTKKNIKIEQIENNQMSPKNFNNFDNFKSQKLKPTNQNDVIKDYLNLVRCTYPYCNCGKCILRNNKEKTSSPNYNYDKNIKSMYKNQFQWNDPEKTDIHKYVKMSRLDKGFKEHLKSGMISVMRNDFKNITSTEPNNETEPVPKSRKNLENTVQMNIPFLGRSSYETLYPNWQTSIDKRNRISSKAKVSIPFSGKSSYKETFGNIEKRYYIEKASPILKKDNLEVGNLGELISLTTSNEFYKPIDLQKSKDLNNVRTQYSGFPGFMLSAPYTKDSFMSSYERAFMNNNFKSYGYTGFNTQN